MTVQDVTPVVTTDTASMGHTLEHARIEQLPINGRNVMNLMATVPGVTFDNGGNLRTFGGRIGTHDVLLDGAALTDEVYGSGTISRPPSLDSIEEFHVEVNATSAKFSRPTSVILVTKSGSNAHPRLPVRNQPRQRLRRGARPRQLHQHRGQADPQRVRRIGRRTGLHPETVQRQEPELLVLFLRRVQAAHRLLRQLPGSHRRHEERGFLEPGELGRDACR